MSAHRHDADESAASGRGGPGTGTPTQRKALRVALGLNGAYLIAEVIGGLAFGSLALLADAGHMVTDVGALALSLLAFRLAERPASEGHTFGLQRAELLAALANAISLALISVLITIEAVRRLSAGAGEVEGLGLLVVAAVGLIVNVVSAVLLARAREDNLNMQGAFVHLVADALGSVAALVAAAAILAFDAAWVDPAVSLLIVVLILYSGWKLIREVTHVLLEGTPRDVELRDVARALHDEEAVERVHHLHVWQLSSGSRALSVHVVAPTVDGLHDAQLLGDRLKERLEDRFSIDHATIELECHDCRERTRLVPPENLSR
ncbi:MAG: cation diffusion facilitator family transporter [Egibacteraceae bacterium]